MLDAYLDSKFDYSKRVIFGSAVLCGVMLGLVSTFSVVMSTASDNKAISKLCFALAFSGVLLLVVANKYELFTGNTMLLSRFGDRSQRGRIVANLAIVYLGNLIGAVGIALMLTPVDIHSSAFDLSAALSAMYDAKTTLPVIVLLIKAFLANYLVCMGVYLGIKGANIVESYFGLVFPIAVFCVLGFEHSIANMFLLPYAVLTQGLPVLPIIPALLLDTVGNILGGVVFALSTRLKSNTSTKNC